VASKTQICNFALGLVAVEGINSIDDATEPARQCRLHLEPTTREVLRLAPWRSCRKRAALVANTAAPAFGWEKSYPLPVNWLRMVSFNDIDPTDIRRELFEIEGRELLTDEATANIIYIQDVTLETGGAGYNLMDALLTKAVYIALAAKLAWPLQQSRTLKESLEQSAEVAAKKAMSANARDAFAPIINPVDGSDWVNARQSSTNG
jgi:hypothetical protein